MEKQKINLNRKILKKEKECEISLDTIVPDIKPDIISIINTNANSYIYKEELSNGKIRLDGNVDGYIIYLSATGETRSLAINLDFSENIEDNNIKEGMRFKNSIKLEKIETKILNERKINVIAKICLYVEFYENIEVEYFKSEESDNEIQKMEKSYNLKMLVGSNKSKAVLKEEMTLETTENIAEILKTEIVVTNLENKISYNKVLSKADAEIKVIYQTEEMKIGVLKSTYPIMSFIDIENVDEKHICETNFKMKNMMFKLNSTESNKIAIQLDFETLVEVYDIKEVKLIQDMYSLDKEIEYSKKEIEVTLDSEISKENIQIEEKIMVEDISNLVDSSAKIRIVNKTSSSSYTNYELEVDLNILYESDDRRGINSKDIIIPCMIKAANTNEEMVFKLNSKNLNLKNEEINCNIEVIGEVYKNGSTKIVIIDNIEEKDCENKNEYSMIVYFVKPCDTIWKIAKMFKVTMQSIIEANNLENPDKIDVGEKLYIVK